MTLGPSGKRKVKEQSQECLLRGKGKGKEEEATAHKSGKQETVIFFPNTD
jgi:hypothetical protein